MPTFGHRIGKQTNRSQHNLVDAPPLATSTHVASSQRSAYTLTPTPSSASSTGTGTGLSSSGESFHIDPRAQQQQQQQQPQKLQKYPPRQQLLHAQQLQQQELLLQQQGQPQVFGGNSDSALESNNPTSGQNVNSIAAATTGTGTGGITDSGSSSIRLHKSQHHQQQQVPELVSRSQSTRYPHQAASIQTPQQFGTASSSADDLSQTLHSPGPPGQPQPPLQHINQTGPAEKRSTRKLFRNILTANRISQSDNRHNNSYDNTSGLARRPSKRVSASFTPSIRTGSQVSLEQQQQQHPDWQQQQSSLNQSQGQSSPLQGLGEIDERYHIQESTTGDSSPPPHPHQNTIRQVPTDIDTSRPQYEEENIAFQQQHAQARFQAIQAAAHSQAQYHAKQSQHPYRHIVVDPAHQEQYRYTHPQGPGQYHQGNPLQLFVGRQQNPETVSQLSHDSPITDPDQRPAHPQSPQTSAVNYSQQELPVRQAQHQQFPVSPLPSATEPVNMTPPAAGPGATRRSGENEKSMRSANNVEPPPGPPPSYRQNQTAPVNSMNPLPPTPSQNQSYRVSNMPERQQFSEGSGQDTGRSSPQPSTGEQDPSQEKQFKDLVTKYKNVKRLYFDGKTQIEQLTSQVEQLQNAVANQRMSQSRTALDDNEYQTRFNRLNGAINNLSFNIRKDWRTLPGWIDRYVSTDALKTGKQEMTAVGRAVIIRWIVDEIFNKCFHPGLELALSHHLKEIEQNIRRNSYTLNSQEEYEALTAKVVNWRMATLQGLQQALQSPESGEHRQDFTILATANLTAHLFQHLIDPPPPGVDGSVGMIVELAVGIAANLSLESRDVALTYPLPGALIKTDIMEPEKTGLPPLPDPDDADDSGKDGDKASKREKTKSGMLNMLSSQQPGSRKGSIVSNTDISDPAPPPPPPPPPKDSSKVRFAGFVAVEVRGRQVLVKAPVWSLG